MDTRRERFPRFEDPPPPPPFAAEDLPEVQPVEKPISNNSTVTIGLIVAVGGSVLSLAFWGGARVSEMQADSNRTRQAEAAVAEVRSTVAGLDHGMAELAAALDRNLSQINARLEAIERRNRTK